MDNILGFGDFVFEQRGLWETTKKDTKVLNKLIDQSQKNSVEMKKIVMQWKKAEGEDKRKLTDKLKELTTLKNGLEGKITAEVEDLDKEVGLEVVKEAEKELE